MAETATKEFVHNLHELPHTVKDACFRLGKTPQSEREESQATFHNLFLHIHSVRVHLRTLSPTLTFGLGLTAAASLVIMPPVPTAEEDLPAMRSISGVISLTSGIKVAPGERQGSAV